MKKFIIFLMTAFLISAGIGYYYTYTHRTIECWWSSLYPTLSFVGFDTNGSNTIEYKSALWEWLKDVF